MYYIDNKMTQEEKRKTYIEKITNRLNGYSLEELRVIYDFMTYKLR
jgi:hypothetical protein